MICIKHIGLIGLGFMGEQHLEAYRHIENAKVTAICTTDQEKGARLAALYNTSHVTHFDDLLTDNTIDIIDICLPTHLHEAYALKAAQAGKHIFCEKPLSLTTDSAERIIQATETHGVRLFVGHVLRFWPAYALIQSYSETGKLKDIEVMHAKRLGQSPAWSTWFQHPEKSGGALFDLHIHDIDYMTALLGDVTAVYAVGHQNAYGAWDHVMTTLTFRNGSRGFAEASHRMQSDYPFTMTLRVQSPHGTMDFHSAAGENIDPANETHTWLTHYTDTGKASIQVEAKDPFQQELQYFVDCLENNQPNTRIPLTDVLYTIKVLAAIERSLETGQLVHI